LQPSHEQHLQGEHLHSPHLQQAQAAGLQVLSFMVASSDKAAQLPQMQVQP